MQIDEAIFTIQNFRVSTEPKEDAKHKKENVYFKDVFITLLELYEEVDEVYLLYSKSNNNVRQCKKYDKQT